MRLTSVMVLVLLLAAFSPTAQACKSKKMFIEFGCGGGFTGQHKDYKLDANGELYLKKDSVNFEKIKTLDKAQTQAIFKNIANVSSDDWVLNDPGNMTYYISYTNNKDAKITKWGGGKQPSDTVKNLYKQLSSSIGNDTP